MSTKSLKEFQKTQLKAHNDLRRKHNSEPLVLDDELNRTALQWAQRMADTGQLSHNPATKYGENVFYTSGNVDSATETWYNEVKSVDPRMPIEQEFRLKQIGHFTQVVWKSTKRFGIAYVKGANGFFVVANYSPAGNMLSSISQNVQL